MSLPLRRHPDTICPPVKAVWANMKLDRSGDVRIVYNVKGDIDALSLAETAFSGRKDELWKTTCFEMFIRPTGQDMYYEFNFSPSTQWAAYGFSGYRQGMSEIQSLLPPKLKVKRLRDRLEVTVILSPGLLALWPEWQVGLSAVIAEQGGRVSYWALAHPPGKPDFHHRDCFATRLSPSGAA